MGALILLIEDTPHNMDLMRYLLQARGHSVIEATQGEAGVDLAAKELPDLMVIDLQLPDIDGFEVLRRIRQNRALSRAPVVAVTAFAMVGDRDRVLNAGFEGYMTKPLDPETFATEVEEFLPESLKGQVIATPDPQTHVDLEEKREAGTGKTILVVDNVASNLQLARSVLEPFGYQVVTAPDVEAALKVTQRDRPDLILCDVHMPTDDGFVLLDELRQNPSTTNIPFVFLSSTSKSEDVVRARSHEVAGFITRPIDPLELLETLEKTLGEHA